MFFFFIFCIPLKSQHNLEPGKSNSFALCMQVTVFLLGSKGFLVSELQCTAATAYVAAENENLLK